MTSDGVAPETAQEERVERATAPAGCGPCPTCGGVREAPAPESMSTPEAVASLMVPRLQRRTCEEMHLQLLDTKAHPIGRPVMVSRGGLAGNLVEPGAVFRRAILRHAAALVLAHNHPSGDPEPSREDVALTQDLARAGEIVGVRVLDHLVIGRGGRWVSLRARGVL